MERCILSKLWYFSLSEMDCQYGDQAGPRLSLRWRFWIGAQRFQQSRTEERYDQGRGLLVVNIFCPWFGEQRQCSGREKNYDSRGSGDWRWRALPDFWTVLRALVAADYQRAATSLPLGSVRQSYHHNKFPFFPLHVAQLDLYQLPPKILTNMLFCNKVLFSLADPKHF